MKNKSEKKRSLMILVSILSGTGTKFWRAAVG